VAGDGEVVAACAADAVRASDHGPVKDAAELGRAAIQLLDDKKRTVPGMVMQWVQ
jgi:hypothetical protein